MYKICKHVSFVSSCVTGNLDIKLDIGIMFIDELLVISESRTLHFSNSDLFVDGRNKVWADLLKVSSLLETFWFLWWIVIIIGNN